MLVWINTCNTYTYNTNMNIIYTYTFNTYLIHTDTHIYTHIHAYTYGYIHMHVKTGLEGGFSCGQRPLMTPWRCAY